MSTPTLPQTERLVLELLLGGPDFGLNLVAKSDGTLKRGTVYVTLGRMERKGFITSEQEPQATGAIGLPRRIYRVTPLGKRALRAWATLLRPLVSEHGAGRVRCPACGYTGSSTVGRRPQSSATCSSRRSPISSTKLNTRRRCASGDRSSFVGTSQSFARSSFRSSLAAPFAQQSHSPRLVPWGRCS